MSNNITDNILSNFNTVEDLKQYATSQYTTIIAQTKKINELERKVESLTSKLQEAEKQVAVSSALSIDQGEGTSDTETVCVIQIAMLKGLAMNRELTLEEVKKLEIFAKTLQLLKGKAVDEKKKEQAPALSTEDLLKLVDSMG